MEVGVWLADGHDETVGDSWGARRERLMPRSWAYSSYERNPMSEMTSRERLLATDPPPSAGPCADLLPRRQGAGYSWNSRFERVLGWHALGVDDKLAIRCPLALPSRGASASWWAEPQPGEPYPLIWSRSGTRPRARCAWPCAKRRTMPRSSFRWWPITTGRAGSSSRSRGRRTWTSWPTCCTILASRRCPRSWNRRARSKPSPRRTTS